MRLLATITLALACLFGTPAQAQMTQGVRTAVCDEAEQVEHFLSAWNGHNTAEAIALANNYAGKVNACQFGVWSFAVRTTYLTGQEGDEAIFNPVGKWAVVEVRVLHRHSFRGVTTYPDMPSRFAARLLQPMLSL